MDQEHIEHSAVSEQSPVIVPTSSQQPLTVSGKQMQSNDTFNLIQRVTAWVMILSAILFALIGLLAVWNAFGSNAGDIIWRSLSSLGIIALAALIVNVAARTVEHRG